MKNESNSSKFKKRYNSPVRSLLQKVYGHPKPVREYKRFRKEKVADTGSDPNGAILEFIKNDIVRPLERLKPPPERISLDTEKWAVGTEKQCSSIEKLPKVQQYKDYYFPNKSQEDAEKYKSFFHKTDNIAIRVPKINKKEESQSYLNLKKKFGPHTETFKEGWVPQGNFKTMNNRSSVPYNILSNDNNPTSGAIVLKILDKKLTNKKKGVAEFSDLTQPYNSNINKKFCDYYDQNHNIFHNYNGIFSHMYDAAHRNGNIVVPFRNNSNVDGVTSHNHNSSNRSRTNSPKNIRRKSPKRDIK